MGQSLVTTMRKLQKALNYMYSAHIVINTTQVFTKGKVDPSTLYTLKKQAWNKDKGKYKYVEVFSTFNVVYMIYYLNEILCTYKGTQCNVSQDYLKYKEQYEEDKFNGK